jgi:hypothetical protein
VKPDAAALDSKQRGGRCVDRPARATENRSPDEITGAVDIEHSFGESRSHRPIEMPDGQRFGVLSVAANIERPTRTEGSRRPPRERVLW